MIKSSAEKLLNVFLLKSFRVARGRKLLRETRMNEFLLPLRRTSINFSFMYNFFRLAAEKLFLFRVVRGKTIFSLH